MSKNVLWTHLMDELDERFEDIDEIKDIYKHGLAGGVSGFIYYSEIREFFFKHENDIEDYLTDQLGVGHLKNWEFDSVNDLIQHMVWSTVECYCSWRIDDAPLEEEELDDEPIKLYADYSKDEAAVLTKQGFEVVNATV